jgi:hypothetical protein
VTHTPSACRAIIRVDVSADGGKTWHTAKLLQDADQKKQYNRYGQDVSRVLSMRFAVLAQDTHSVKSCQHVGMDSVGDERPSAGGG